MTRDAAQRPDSSPPRTAGITGVRGVGDPARLPPGSHDCPLCLHPVRDCGSEATAGAPSSSGAGQRRPGQGHPRGDNMQKLDPQSHRPGVASGRGGFQMRSKCGWGRGPLHTSGPARRTRNDCDCGLYEPAPDARCHWAARPREAETPGRGRSTPPRVISCPWGRGLRGSTGQ